MCCHWLGSGFLEPLESTSIYLIQVAIMKLLDFFPNKNIDAILECEFNRQLNVEYTKIRDFIILHYHATQRDDSEFWRYCKNMPIPAALQYRQQVFRESGHIDHTQYGVNVAVYCGQNVIPQHYDSRVDFFPEQDIKKYLEKI